MPSLEVQDTISRIDTRVALQIVTFRLTHRSPPLRLDWVRVRNWEVILAGGFK